MTGELAIPDTAATMPAKIQYSKALAEAGLLPATFRQKPANVLYALEYADMLGLAPMAAITGIHVIEGRPSVSAALISALVRRAGHKLRVMGDDTQAQAFLTRSDDPGFTYKAVWTIERAKQANLLNKQNWRQYPAAMLKARAISEVARDACQEVLLGLYTPDELGFAGITDAEADEIGVMTTGQRVEHNELRRMGEPDPGAVEKLDRTPDDDPWYDPDPAAQEPEAPPAEPAPPATLLPADKAQQAAFRKFSDLTLKLGLSPEDVVAVLEWLAPAWRDDAGQLRTATSTLEDFLKSAGGDIEQARSDMWSRYRTYNKMAGIDG